MNKLHFMFDFQNFLAIEAGFSQKGMSEPILEASKQR